MKILIYFVLIIAFLMFYRQNPTFSIIILVLFLAAYWYYKRRKGGGRSVSRGTFLSGRAIQRDSHVEDLVTLTVLQQMLNSPTPVKSSGRKPTRTQEDQRTKDIEKTRKEIIDLLED